MTEPESTDTSFVTITQDDGKWLVSYKHAGKNRAVYCQHFEKQEDAQARFDRLMQDGLPPDEHEALIRGADAKKGQS